jgi:dTDP-4-dehydrorhamnose 3,5-epimerase
VGDRFQKHGTQFDELIVLERLALSDERGFLERLFCERELSDVLKGRSVVQINRTLTRGRGTVRGFHWQRPPHAEVKVVSCLRGEIYDVAVDVRAGSPTFGQWHAENLSERNRRSMVIPEGFAHGFQCLSEECELLYLHTAAYAPSAEAGFNVLDPAVTVPWPLPVVGRSTRDVNWTNLQDAEK